MNSLAQHIVELESCSQTGICLLDRRERTTALSWAELAAAAARTAGSLAALGIKPNERVALMYDTSADLLVALMACWRLGAAPTPIYPPVRLARIEEWTQRSTRLLKKCGARLLLTNSLAKPWLGEVIKGAQLPLGCKSLKQLPAATATPALASRENIGLVQFSSGTTGEPKAVVLSQAALIKQCEMLSEPMKAHFPGIEQHGSGCGWLPLYHDMGLIGLFLTACLHAKNLTLISPKDFLLRPALWLRAMSATKAPISVGPSFAYALCVDRIRDDELEGVDLSHWEIALNGAEPVSPETMHAFAQRFSRWGFKQSAMTPVYGLSEGALAVTFSDLGSPPLVKQFDDTLLQTTGEVRLSAKGRAIVSCGTVLSGCEIEIRRNGAITDGVGRIFIRSASMMEGYLGEEQLAHQTLTDGWLDTGDTGFLFQGELYVIGRAKDVLIIRGANHDPTLVERAADEVEGARTGCCVAASWRPDGHSTEILALFVEHAKSATPASLETMAEAVAKAVSDRTGLAPDLVEILPPGTLPRTSSGKLRRAEAKSLYQQGQLVAPADVTRRFLARAALRSGAAWVKHLMKASKRTDAPVTE